MCDFTKYGGKSAEWLRLEETLPPPPENISQEELQRTANQGREDAAREEMKALSPKVVMQDHSISARDGYMLEARSYRPSSVEAMQILPMVSQPSMTINVEIRCLTVATRPSTSTGEVSSSAH